MLHWSGNIRFYSRHYILIAGFTCDLRMNLGLRREVRGLQTMYEIVKRTKVISLGKERPEREDGRDISNI